jgi:hypothetical protein
MISVLFSLTSSTQTITEDERSFIAKNSIQFHEINTRFGRTLYQATVPTIDKVQIFATAYVSRSPKVIGCWLPDGSQHLTSQYDENGDVISSTPTYPFNEAEYLVLQPDKVVTVDEDTTNLERYMSPQQINNFAGWKDKQF